MRIFDLGSHSGEDGHVQITLTTSEADSLAAVLHEHVIKGEMFAGHSGPIRRAYPYLTELAQAICKFADTLDHNAVPESHLLDLLQEEGLGEGGQALGLDECGQILIYTGYRYISDSEPTQITKGTF